LYKKYEDLTLKELEEITNGCGAKGGIVVPPYATMWNADCNHHDYGYWKGGNSWDRWRCDNKLWWSLQKDSLKWGWKVHKVLWFSAWSALYYAGVRIGGWRAFSYK
jgi:hypothetical protein